MVLHECNTIERDYQRLAVATLVVSAAAVVGVKVYTYYSMPELMRANLEALTQKEVERNIIIGHCEDVIPYANCYYDCCNIRWTDPNRGILGKLVSVEGKCSICGKLVKME